MAVVKRIMRDDRRPTGGQRHIGRDSRHGPHWRQWLLAFLLVAAMVVTALHFGDLKKFAELVGQAKPLWLIGALLLQLSTYVSLAGEWFLVLRAGKSPRPMRKLLPLTISKLFADQVVPTAGVSGHVFLVERLAASGVLRELAVAAVILAVIGYYLSYAV